MKQDDTAIAAFSDGNPDVVGRTHDVSGAIIDYLVAGDEGPPAACGEIGCHMVCRHDIAVWRGAADRWGGCILDVNAALGGVSAFRM